MIPWQAGCSYKLLMSGNDVEGIPEIKKRPPQMQRSFNAV
jgi:hypothetical protein